MRPVRLAFAVILAVLGALLWGSAHNSAHADHALSAVHQCNADTYPTGAGWEASCEVLVENTRGSDGATQSRVTTTWCLAEAGVLPPEGCDSEVATSGSLVTAVDQCNGILAGGSNLTCRVDVINNVPFGAQATGVTVNQCIGSGQGGVSPGGPPTNCNPEDTSTSGATVTQCNGSANGGGAPERVQCSVTGATSALPTTVNQCNGSTAAGSTVTCEVSFTNRFAAEAVDRTTPWGPIQTIPIVVTPSGPIDAGPVPTVSVTQGGSSTSSGLVDTGPGPDASVTQGGSSTSSEQGRPTGPTLPVTGSSTTILLPVALVGLAFMLRALLRVGRLPSSGG